VTSISEPGPDWGVTWVAATTHVSQFLRIHLIVANAGAMPHTYAAKTARLNPAVIWIAVAFKSIAFISPARNSSVIETPKIAEKCDHNLHKGGKCPLFLYFAILCAHPGTQWCRLQTRALSST